jgi:hypothetical protein
VASGLLELVGTDALCSVLGGGAEVRLAAADAVALLTGWAARYYGAARRDGEAELATIGQEMFGWLDGRRIAT